MVKSLAKKMSVVMLAFIAAVTFAFGLTSLSFSTAKADGTKAVEDIIDLSKGPNDSVGQPTADGSSNLIKVHFKGVDMSDGSLLENLDGFNDKLVIGTDSEEKTVAAWMSDAGGSRAFRIAVYGAGMYIQCESEATVIAAKDIKYVTFKKGFTLYEGTTGTAGDWVFTKTATTKVEGTEFPADLKLYVNRSVNAYQYATSELSVATQPSKTEYLVGETFAPAGMTLTAVTETSGTKTVEVKSDMCTADFSEEGEKTVTVSYGGKTATVNVTVKAPEKVLSSVAYKSGSVSVEQNGSAKEMTLNALKIKATYEDGTTEDVEVTADMISVDPAFSGKVNGKIIYSLGTKTATCPVEVTVTERKSKYTADNTYPIPLDGYYEGEDGGDRVLGDQGISIWFTTNAGYGKENVYEGLGEKWYSLAGFEAATSDINDHVLINGKTFSELNAEGAGFARFVLGWYGNGLYCLRIHTDGSFKSANVETITLLKGFRMYNTSAKALGVPTPCDYAFEAVAKPGTSEKMLVRKTESVETLTAPEKTEYNVGDKFSADGMTLKATYTDGGTAIIEVKDRMVSYDFSSAAEESPVTVTYNGKSVIVNAKVVVPPVTLESIAVKDGATLSLKKYSRKITLSEGAKLVLTYSDETTEEVELNLDMISGYANENVGNGKATVTYKGLTCEMDYSVSEYDGKSYFGGINYGTVTVRDSGTGFTSFVGINDVAKAGFSLKALWDVDKAQSAVIGKTNGEFITINGVTFAQLLKEGKVSRMYTYGEEFEFHIDDADFMATVKNGAEICFLPGFAWVTYASDATGTASNPSEYTMIENAVVTEPMYFCFKDGEAAKVIKNVTLKGEPKTSYFKGDVINVSGLTLEVEYKGPEKEEIEVTTEMCDYDFNESGEKTVKISFAGKTVSFNVTVKEISLTGIEIETAPAKTDYDFGIDNELVLEGLVVKAVYDDGSEEIIDNASLSFEGFDSRKFGTQAVTVKYGEFTDEFAVNVLDISKNKYLSIEYDSGATSYEATSHKALVISFVMNGIYEDLSSFWGTDHFDYVADYMLINGKKVSELIKEGKVTRLATWASQIVIHLDTNELVPATWVNENETDKPHYIEGVSEVVETVTFLPGFQWYTTVPVSSENWGNSGFYGAVALKGAVLKEKIELTNIDGYGWRRELKQNENGETAEDALTLKSLPTKVTYKVGEPLDLTGTEILAKYNDGGEAIITPNYSETEGYNRNQVGEQTITYTYNGVTVSFKVTVEEEKTPDSGNSGEESGCIGSAGVSGFAVVVLAAAACVRKKRENY